MTTIVPGTGLAHRPWDLGPRFPVSLTNPVTASDWSWRELGSGHPAIAGRPAFIRRGDAEGAIDVISERYGEPTAHCVLGANLACVLGWRGLSYDTQYRAVTEGAGAFPCGGMYYLRVAGPDAARALDLLTPRSIEALEIGQAAFAIFTTPEGTVDTEGVVLRDAAESYTVSVGGDTRPPSWLYDALDACPDADASEAALTTFNIKGPTRDDAMGRLLVEKSAAALAELAPFHSIEVQTRDGGTGRVLRTLIGIEMWAEPTVVNAAWRRMVADPEHVTPCGWDVLATYRLECSAITFFLCPLDVHRWTYLHDAGLDQAVSPGKQTPYVGRAALADQGGRSGGLWVAGLVALSSGSPRRAVGEALLRESNQTSGGFVTTAGWSPVAGRELCFAQLANDIGPGAVVQGSDGSAWRVVPLPILPHLGGGDRPQAP